MIVKKTYKGVTAEIYLEGAGNKFFFIMIMLAICEFSNIYYSIILISFESLNYYTYFTSYTGNMFKFEWNLLPTSKIHIIENRILLNLVSTVSVYHDYFKIPNNIIIYTHAKFQTDDIHKSTIVRLFRFH